MKAEECIEKKDKALEQAIYRIHKDICGNVSTCICGPYLEALHLKPGKEQVHNPGKKCKHAAPSEPRFYDPCPKCGYCAPNIGECCVHANPKRCQERPNECCSTCRGESGVLTKSN